MVNMANRVLAAAVVLVLVIALSGCKKPEEETGFTIDMYQVAEEFFAEMGSSHVRVADGIAAEIYGLDGEYGEFVIYQAGAETNADMVVIIKTTGDNVFLNREALEAIQKINLAKWETYLPLEYAKVENYMIINKYPYLFYVISDVQDEIRNIIENY